MLVGNVIIGFRSDGCLVNTTSHPFKKYLSKWSPSTQDRARRIILMYTYQVISSWSSCDLDCLSFAAGELRTMFALNMMTCVCYDVHCLGGNLRRLRYNQIFKHVIQKSNACGDVEGAGCRIEHEVLVIAVVAAVLEEVIGVRLRLALLCGVGAGHGVGLGGVEVGK